MSVKEFPYSKEPYYIGCYEPTGGSSDFSTVEVTFVNNSALRFDFSIPNIVDEEEETAALGNIDSAGIGSGVTINVILYKGYCLAALNMISQGTPVVALSGDISDLGNSNYLITGDCTITLSDSE